MMKTVIGSVDESNVDQPPTDFLISIDASGSMSAARNTVIDTICSWGQQGRFDQSRFAVIYFGLGNVSQELIYSMIVTDFVSATEACNRLLAFSVSSGGYEFQVDTAIDSFLSTSHLYLSWSQNQRRAILFTDEGIQSAYQDPIQEAITSCTNNSYSISIFLDRYTPDYPFFQQVTQGCGGFLEEIDLNNSILLREKLDYYFGEEC